MELGTAFIIGLLGSLHCAGMCGPIALSLPLAGSEEKKGISPITGQILYNTGRTISYGLLGALVGTLGWTIAMAGFQQWLCIATGAVMLAFLLFSRMKKVKHFLLSLINRGLAKIKGLWPALYKKRNAPSLFAIGFLNGFLPCGLVYVALATAATLGHIGKSALFMAFFGLGTFPMMASLVHSGYWLKGNLRKKLTQTLPVVTAVIAVLLIIRGLGLGIPYVSPKITPQGGSCCHHGVQQQAHSGIRAYPKSR